MGATSLGLDKLMECNPIMFSEYRTKKRKSYTVQCMEVAIIIVLKLIICLLDTSAFDTIDRCLFLYVSDSSVTAG